MASEFHRRRTQSASYNNFAYGGSFYLSGMATKFLLEKVSPPLGVSSNASGDQFRNDWLSPKSTTRQGSFLFVLETSHIFRAVL